MANQKIINCFNSKAKTLEKLIPIIKNAKILPILRFNVNQFTKDKDQIISSIQSKFKSNIIVRSSSSNEDNKNSSNAGGFESVLDVDINSAKKISHSIIKVINSYGSKINKNDEVFIQPMLKNVSMSGVIFTTDIDTLSPYYIINYDESGSTNSVTSGNSNKLKTFISYKSNKKINDRKLNQLILAAKECEGIFEIKYLDIEFAFVKKELFLFQVRPIVIEGKENLSNFSLDESLKKLYKKIKKLNSAHPNLLGDKTIFGVMPDWNPAEIIGLRPKRLALSLYKELITDETWAYQRDNYGYRNLRSHPLLVTFIGIPYIDVRVSFNSFIPKSLENNIASKLVDYYLSKLHKNTHHHDKVEFEIIYSCYYFGLEKKLLNLKKEGFDIKEINKIKKSLIDLTNNIIDIKNGLYKKDLEKVEILKIKFDQIVNSNLALVDKIYWLIKDSRRYGTLPFAGIARAAFIAIQFLKSFLNEKIINAKEYSNFLNSLKTVSKELSNDLIKLSKNNFLKIYGHLRPGTYDIMSSRYDEAYDYYFKDKDNLGLKVDKSFTFNNNQKLKIKKFIQKADLSINVEDLLIFIKEAIEGREYAKFIFTKSLSKVLVYLERFGSRFGIKKEELSYLDIQKILDLYSTLDQRNVEDILNSNIEMNKEFYNYTKSVKLPDLIVSPENIYSFNIHKNEPNYVTMNNVQSSIVTEKNISHKKLEGKIICISSADPGYDFLFSKNIGGLITCFGGANSHMAIRCAELGIPAVIGCGEIMFKKYNESKFIKIDAANKNVIIIR